MRFVLALAGAVLLSFTVPAIAQDSCDPIDNLASSWSDLAAWVEKNSPPADEKQVDEGVARLNEHLAKTDHLGKELEKTAEAKQHGKNLLAALDGLDGGDPEVHLAAIKDIIGQLRAIAELCRCDQG